MRECAARVCECEREREREYAVRVLCVCYRDVWCVVGQGHRQCGSAGRRDEREEIKKISNSQSRRGVAVIRLSIRHRAVEPSSLSDILIAKWLHDVAR